MEMFCMNIQCYNFTLLCLTQPQQFCGVCVYYICEVKITVCVFVMCYRYFVNSEQCAVYQQQCCHHHGYWNW